MGGARAGEEAAADPCAAMRAQAAGRCAAAARLAQAASDRARELRRARHALAEMERQQDAALRATGRRSVMEAKEDAQARYREHRRRQKGPAAASAAAAEWLRDIDLLNRAARRAAPRPEGTAQRRIELEAQVAGLVLQADADRIAAEASAAACQDLRRDLARCEEAVMLTTHGPPAAVSATSAIVALAEGDAAVLDDLADETASATGLARTDARRLLALLGGAVADSALAAGWLNFPSDHPFWRQFPEEDCRRIARALSTLGSGFDGRAGWRGGRTADVRLLAMALADAGHDIRAIRYSPSPSEMERLWQGARVEVADHLAAVAPNLALNEVMTLAAGRQTPLGPVWDRWGSIRPLLAAATAGRS